MFATRKEKVQCWLALFLTCGEFAGAFWLIIHHGNFFYVYLAVTTIVRETTGGRHYHRILVDAYYKCRAPKQRVDDNPFA